MTLWNWAAKQPIIKGKNEYGEPLDVRVVPTVGTDTIPTDRYAYRRVEFLKPSDIAKTLAFVTALIGYKPDTYENPGFEGTLDALETRRDVVIDVPIPDEYQEAYGANFLPVAVGRIFGTIFLNDMDATGALEFLPSYDSSGLPFKFVPAPKAQPEVYRRPPVPAGYHYELSNGMMSDMILVKD